MEKEKPNYYAILTADVRYDKRLSSSEKLIYAEIVALSNTNKRCHAGNSYFAELYEVGKGTISRWINNLKKYGYVNIVINRNGKQVVSRYITPISKNDDTLCAKMSIPYTQKTQYPISKKRNTLYSKNAKRIIQDINNTRYNNTSNNKGLTDFDIAFNDFVEMRKTIKKPLTEKAKGLALKKLYKLSSDKKEQIEILNNSIMNCWQGLFALKKENGNGGNKDFSKMTHMEKALYNIKKIDKELDEEWKKQHS